MFWHTSHSCSAEWTAISTRQQPLSARACCWSLEAMPDCQGMSEKGTPPPGLHGEGMFLLCLCFIFYAIPLPKFYQIIWPVRICVGLWTSQPPQKILKPVKPSPVSQSPWEDIQGTTEGWSRGISLSFFSFPQENSADANGLGSCCFHHFF